MTNGEVELRILDGQWNWCHIGSNGFDICQSRRRFRSRGAALDDYDKCKADFFAEQHCRNQVD